MNRSRSVSTLTSRLIALLLPLLGFGLVYGLPMLGLHFAVEHGLYVASAATVVPFLRATPLERIAEVRGYHEHDGRRCAHVVLAELDGAPEFECCVWVDELHVEGVHTAAPLPPVDREKVEGVSDPHPLFLRSQEKLSGDATENRTSCTCGHRAAIHLASLGGGCWATRPEGGLACECEQYTPDLFRGGTKNPQASHVVDADKLGW